MDFYSSIALYAFQLIKGKVENPIWELNEDLPKDLVLGMIAIGLPLLNIINKDQNKKYLETRVDYQFIVTDENGEEYNVPDLESLVEGSVEYSLIEEDYISQYHMSKNTPQQYSVWVASDSPDLYDLIVFDSPEEFFQGFITMANAFKVDYRDYFYGYITDKNGNLYDVIE